MASIHDTAEGPHTAGVMDKQTMREFDDACLTSVRPLTAAEIRAPREREGAGQAVLARYLNVATGLVSQRERGEKHPEESRSSFCRPWRSTGCEPSRDWRQHSAEPLPFVMNATKDSNAVIQDGPTRLARGFPHLASSTGYLTKEIFLLGSAHGAAGDGDDRQGNGARRGDAAGLFFASQSGRSRNVNRLGSR
jgi:putative transcriptional regulator